MFTVQLHPNPIQSDILAEIFTSCLPDVPKDRWETECMSTRKAPLLLCSVCSSWRSLAISTPRLWQRMYLHSTDWMLLSDMRDAESITNGIRTWLDRSKALPLSIRLNFCADPKSYQAIKCRLTLKVLLQEVSRWESFELIEGGDRFWVTPPDFGILPMLHTFNISYSSIDGIPFTEAPRLKRLDLFSLPNLSVSAIPRDQLVELTIEKVQTTSVVVEIIRRCHRLESLLLKVEDGDEDSSLAFRSITQHNTLRRLHLRTRAHINAVTDHLTLPALTDLSLWGDQSIPEVEAKICCSQFVDFFTRSNCELQEFELRCHGFGPSELLECLNHRSCQTLTRLVISQRDKSSPSMVNRDLLIRMTYRDGDDDVPLCPKLAQLELFHCYISDRLFPDLLGRMIQSRCFGRALDARLRSLRLANNVRHYISREDGQLLQFSKNFSGLKLKYT